MDAPCDRPATDHEIQGYENRSRERGIERGLPFQKGIYLGGVSVKDIRDSITNGSRGLSFARRGMTGFFARPYGLPRRCAPRNDGG